MNEMARKGMIVRNERIGSACLDTWILDFIVRRSLRLVLVVWFSFLAILGGCRPKEEIESPRSWSEEVDWSAISGKRAIRSVYR